MRASLVVQGLRIHLATQETLAQSLVWEDPTSRGATKPLRSRACVQQLLKPALYNRELPQEESPRSLQQEEACVQ